MSIGDAFAKMTFDIIGWAGKEVAKAAWSKATAPSAQERARQEARDKAAQCAAAEERERTRIRLQEERSQRLRPIVCNEHLIIIDSNVWMEPGLHGAVDRLCSMLHESQATLQVHGEQYDELERIRKRTSGVDSAEGAERSRKANAAIQLMRDLASKGQLRLAETREEGVHVDDYIVNQVDINLANGRQVLVVTDDVKLQTRLYSSASIAGHNPSLVMTGSELLSVFGEP